MTKSIPKEVKSEVLKMVKAFNEEHKTTFQITFRDQFAYLAKTEKPQINMPNTFQQMISQKKRIQMPQLAERDAPVVETKLGRFKYNGQMDNWDFAVFISSRDFYDAEYSMFP